MPIKSHTSCQNLQVIEIICFCFSILFKTRCTCLSYECECAQVWQKVLPLLGCALFKQLLILFSQLANFARRLWSGLVGSGLQQVSAGECVTVISIYLSPSLSLSPFSYLLQSALKCQITVLNLLPLLCISVPCTFCCCCCCWPCSTLRKSS